MAFQRLGIIDALIAEHTLACIDFAGIADQHIPEIMPNLVAEMSQQRAIRLVHRGPEFGALHIIRLVQVDDDDAFIMAGEDFRTARQGLRQETRIPAHARGFCARVWIGSRNAIRL